eukprot:Amastigsp_a342470_10.p4 type:complete len:111 gc:universal Amastigsp_a342470_10:770-438(-)
MCRSSGTRSSATRCGPGLRFTTAKNLAAASLPARVVRQYAMNSSRLTTPEPAVSMALKSSGATWALRSRSCTTAIHCGSFTLSPREPTSRKCAESSWRISSPSGSEPSGK